LWTYENTLFLVKNPKMKDSKERGLNEKNNQIRAPKDTSIIYEESTPIFPEDSENSQTLDENKGFFVRLIAILIAVSIIVFFIIPNSIFEPENKPLKIPTLKELNDKGFLSNLSIKPLLTNQSIVEQLLIHRTRISPELKTIADYIASQVCPYKKGNNELCYAKAIYFFVRDNIQYIPDPVKTEFIEPPQITLKSGSADCDGISVLLSSLFTHIGIESRYLLLKNHIFIEIKLKNPSRYENKDGYIPLDAACKDCDFGELPNSVKIEPLALI